MIALLDTQDRRLRLYRAGEGTLLPGNGSASLEVTPGQAQQPLLGEESAPALSASFSPPGRGDREEGYPVLGLQLENRVQSDHCCVIAAQ